MGTIWVGTHRTQCRRAWSEGSKGSTREGLCELSGDEWTSTQQSTLNVRKEQNANTRPKRIPSRTFSPRQESGTHEGLPRGPQSALRRSPPPADQQAVWGPEERQ